MSQNEKYRRQAEICLDLAEASSGDAKARWLAMAQRWLRLALFNRRPAGPAGTSADAGAASHAPMFSDIATPGGG